MTIFYHSPEELDKLPDQAVVYDHSNQVWQKLHDRDRYNIGLTWFKPGQLIGYQTLDIELPARLLDDGP